MACKDSGSTSEDKEELEDAIPPAALPRARQPPTASIGSTTVLEGTTKKKDQKRRRDRAKRKATTLVSLSSTTPPVPMPRVLEKATQAIPIAVAFAAADLRATKPWWTGLAQPLKHPLLAHAHNAEFLKKHLQYADWDGQ
jgi:hypothetical protein